MLKALYTHYSPVPAGQVIHNGRSSSLFAASAKESFILTAGRLWDKAKNVQLMQQIASDIPWPIRVAGEVREPGSRQSAHLSGLEMLGRLSAEELRTQYGKASIYAAPAKYEPFGLSILEAAFSGCPLVLGDIPSLREIWDGAAAFVHPEKPDQLRKMLIQLIRSPQLRQSLALRARRRAANFSVQRMAGSYVKLYRSLVKPGRRSNAVLKLASPRGL
jgi:glycosyltransferase involved in cell wall biosynthesis